MMIISVLLFSSLLLLYVCLADTKVVGRQIRKTIRNDLENFGYLENQSPYHTVCLCALRTV